VDAHSLFGSDWHIPRKQVTFAPAQEGRNGKGLSVFTVLANNSRVRTHGALNGYQLIQVFGSRGPNFNSRIFFSQRCRRTQWSSVSNSTRRTI
jgi:hypothetical protein